MTDKGSSIQRLGQQMMNPSIPQSRIQHPRHTQEVSHVFFNIMLVGTTGIFTTRIT